jgi:hypothetical protein
MAVSTAKNVLAGLDGELDPNMVFDRQVLGSRAAHSRSSSLKP